jgi:hypothetical protein
VNLQSIDPASLWHIRVIGDLKAGEIIAHYPITADGETDPVRQMMYKGRCQLNMQGPMGVMQVPVTFDLAGPTLREALDSFAGAMQKAVEDIESKIRQEQMLAAGRQGNSKFPPRRQ